jgi:hypothetical protein
MKIDANGNEVSIGFSSHEIYLLQGASLIQKANFYSPLRETPSEVRLCLSLFPEPFMSQSLDTEGVYVSTNPPNSYFPDAQSVFLVVGDEMFDELVREHYSCRRRNVDKIKLYNLGRKNEVYR